MCDLSDKSKSERRNGFPPVFLNPCYCLFLGDGDGDSVLPAAPEDAAAPVSAAAETADAADAAEAADSEKEDAGQENQGGEGGVRGRFVCNANFVYKE